MLRKIVLGVATLAFSFGALGGSALATSVTATHLTQGGVKVMSPSIQTASISPGPNGMILVWILTLSTDSNPAPTPSVSGLGLTFTQVQSVTKVNQGTRRLTLLQALVPGTIGSGPLTIASGGTYSYLSYSVEKAGGATLAQVATRVDGGFVTTYSISFTNSTMAGDAAIAGFGIGNHDTITPGASLTTLGQGNSPGIGVTFTEWTGNSVQTLDCSWTNLAHSMAISVEVAP